MFTYFTIEEILPSKFASKLTDAISDGWELTDVTSNHSSGFTLHRAMFKKYDENQAS